MRKIQDITPYKGKVIIKVDAHAEKTAGGIIIPDIAKKKDSIDLGTVVKLGIPKKNKKEEIIPFKVKVGDNVIFNRYSGVEIKIEDSENVHRIMDEEFIWSILK